MKALLEKIANLIDVKSLITLGLTVVFAILTLRGAVPQEFLQIYTVTIAFYFGVQYQKNIASNETTTTTEEKDDTETTDESNS